MWVYGGGGTSGCPSAVHGPVVVPRREASSYPGSPRACTLLPSDIHRANPRMNAHSITRRVAWRRERHTPHAPRAPPPAQARGPPTRDCDSGRRESSARPSSPAPGSLRAESPRCELGLRRFGRHDAIRLGRAWGAVCTAWGGVHRSTKYLVMSLTAGDAYLEVSPKLEVREVAMRGGGGGVLVHLPRGSCSRQSRPRDRQGSWSCRRVCAS